MAVHEELIATLEAHSAPVIPEDTMAEAGRKVLLADFIRMLQHEAGSRGGENIEDLHQMRVATRRMRSTLHLLTPYLKSKLRVSYERRLRKIARALGDVRDLDVLLLDLANFHTSAGKNAQASVQTVSHKLNTQRDTARQDMVNKLDVPAYSTFVRDFGMFLITPGLGAKTLDDDRVIPTQVRHLAPVIIHTHLAAVRAYDTVLADADAETRHALRVEFKQLRYTVAFFNDILGSSVKEFIEDLKTIQDHLGRLNDITVALASLRAVLKTEDELHTIALGEYFSKLEAESQDLQNSFMEVWARFNSRTTQRKLSDALLVLR